MPVLRIKLPDNRGEIAHVLAGDRITIGRRPDNTIQIIDRTVSGHHAELLAVNGHYRLRDLGSTNLTCVDGQAVSDFHLHGICKVSFGSIECEFTPETPVNTIGKSEVVPTRAELEFLRRDNLDLEAKIHGMQKQIDILSSARLMTKDTQNLGVMPEVHKRVQHERDELRTKNANLQLDLEHLRADVASLAKERDALRIAWETVRHDRDSALAKFGIDASAAGPNPAAPEIASVGEAYETTRGVSDHRALAAVLTNAPACMKNIQAALMALGSDGTNDEAADALTANSVALAQTLAALSGHPAQRLATACATLVKDARTRCGRIEPEVVTTLRHGCETIASLLDPRSFKRTFVGASPRTLIVDDDPDVLETLDCSLKSASFQSSRCMSAEEALDLLQRERFDVVLLDIALPGLSGFDVCAKIRSVPANKSTAVIFMTGADSVENRAQSSVTGGDDFIAKPLNMAELMVKTSAWACRHELARAS
ncbi:MAG: response regulator [Chthoniobacteraceae bacterium]